MNRVAFGKELRALFPAFFATLLTIALATQAGRFFSLRLVLLVAVLGPIVLGAMVIGHEYSYRTVTLLLAQPLSRARLLAAKAAVLLPMVAAIAAAAFFALREGFARSDNARTETLTLLALAPLCGVCFAPALSMLCRSPLAAIIFTIAIPCLITLFAQIAGTAIHGFHNPRIVNDFAFAVTWPVITVLCLVGALATWYLFNRLQAIEGHAELDVPAWFRPDTRQPQVSRVRGVWSALIRKELRLHQLAFVVAGLYLLAAVGTWSLKAYAPEFPRIPIEALSVIYSGLLAVLLGAVASAEERQLGTLASQLIQPIAAWKQWAVKVATVVGLSLLLAIVLPFLVTTLDGPEMSVNLSMRFLQQTMVPLIILTSISLYVSSLSSSGIRAMVASLPVIVGGGFLSLSASGILVRAVRRTVPFAAEQVPSADRIAAYRQIAAATDAALLAGLVMVAATALSLGYINHRRIDRSRSGLIVQAAILGTVVVFVAVVPTIVFLALRPGT